MPFSKRQMQRILDPDLIPATRWPSLAGRVCESWLKRRLFAVEDQAVRDELAMFNAAYRDMRRTADLLADELGIGALDKGGLSIEWRNRMMTAVETRLDTLYAQVARHAAEHTLLAYYVGFYGRAWLLDMVTKPDIQVNVPLLNGSDVLARILRPDRYLEQFDAFDDLIWSMLGREWQQAFVLEKADVILRIRRAIGVGQSQGLGIRETMRQVSDALGVSTDRRTKAADVRANFARVQTITRTTMLTASNDGALALYLENRDILHGVEWLTARDERVCKICRGYDGDRWEFDDPFRLHPPGDSHPNCRCTILPWPKDPEDFLPEADPEPPRQTLDEWLVDMGLSWLLGSFVRGRKLDSERVA